MEARKPEEIMLADQIGGARASKIIVRDLNFFYGRAQALHGINLEIQERVVTAFIGPPAAASQPFFAR